MRLVKKMMPMRDSTMKKMVVKVYGDLWMMEFAIVCGPGEHVPFAYSSPMTTRKEIGDSSREIGRAHV